MNQPKYEDVISFEALMKSAKLCSKGVKWKASIQTFMVRICEWCMNLHMDLENDMYKHRRFSEFYIMERGKRRFIQSVYIADRVVQKSLCMNGLKPIIEPLLIADNSASRVGKGTVYAIKRLKQSLASHYRKYGHNGGILTMDLHDYFHSIDQDILLRKLDEIIEDKRILKLTEKFIRQFTNGGLGLGSEVCQICAIFYPNDIDHMVSNMSKVEAYARYMDDSYIISNDIEFLTNVMDIIIKAYAELNIYINPKKTHITKFDGGHFEYMKKRWHIDNHGKIIIRPIQTVFTKWRQLLKKQKTLYDDGVIKMSSIRDSYYSKRASLSPYNCRKSLHNMDLLYYNLFNEKIIINKKKRSRYLNSIKLSVYQPHFGAL